MPLERNAQPGDIYTTETGEIWRVVGYQPNPTVILERLRGPCDEPVRFSTTDCETHAVGCLNADKFTRLRKQD